MLTRARTACLAGDPVALRHSTWLLEVGSARAARESRNRKRRGGRYGRDDGCEGRGSLGVSMKDAAVAHSTWAGSQLSSRTLHAGAASTRKPGAWLHHRSGGTRDATTGCAPGAPGGVNVSLPSAQAPRLRALVGDLSGGAVRVSVCVLGTSE